MKCLEPPRPADILATMVANYSGMSNCPVINRSSRDGWPGRIQICLLFRVQLLYSKSLRKRRFTSYVSLARSSVFFFFFAFSHPTPLFINHSLVGDVPCPNTTVTLHIMTTRLFLTMVLGVNPSLGIVRRAVLCAMKFFPLLSSSFMAVL